MSGELHADLLAFAHELADAADTLTLASFGTAPEATDKHDGSPVSAVDIAVEELLRERIGQRWPQHTIVGEELGTTTTDAEFAWYLDPIDGTKNYLRGMPAWATLICVQRSGAPAVAVISAPALQARWDADIDVGARRDGRAIHVATTARLSESTLSLGGLSWFEPHGGAALIGRLTAATARQRGFGDFWHHCLVAEGVIDGALEGAVSEWDLAAVRCLVQAAGGVFMDFTGADRIDGGTAVSCAPGVAEQLLALVRP